MQKILLGAALVGLTAAKVVKDPAKCALYTPGANEAGSWKVVEDTTQENCLAEGGQWILGWGQSLYPDHHPVPKSWWTKRMSDTGGADVDQHDRLYFSGRPAVRDLKQLYEAGWDAVLSLEDVAEGGEKLGIQPLPNTADARKVAAEAGLLFHSLPASLDFTSEQGVDEISNFLDFALESTGSKFNGPVLVFDKAGFNAAAALQLYRARKGLVPKDTSKTVTEQATKEANFHGITFPTQTIRAIAREAKEDVGTDPVVFPGMRVLPASVADSLSSYHWLKYLYHIGDVGVFDAGQVQVHHVEALKAANIKAIINMRQGAMDQDGAMIPGTQEPVNLLNLEFGGPTKGIGSEQQGFLDNPAKKAFVIDENRPASWACEFDAADPAMYTACVTNKEFNFEAANPLEWGDAVGQNAFTEADAFKEAGIAYYHLPVGAMQQPLPKPFNAATFAEYAPQFIEAVNIAHKLGGHVLFHCTIGYRTGAFPTALLTLLNDELTVHDANAMMHSWGYDVVDEQTGHVFERGTNTLFKALNTLAFEGDVDWSNGRIDGDINLLSTNDGAGDSDTAKTKPISTTPTQTTNDSSSDGVLVAILIFSILAFAAASGALYMLYTQRAVKKSTYHAAADSEEISMSQMSNVPATNV